MIFSMKQVELLGLIYLLHFLAVPVANAAFTQFRRDGATTQQQKSLQQKVVTHQQHEQQQQHHELLQHHEQQQQHQQNQQESLQHPIQSGTANVVNIPEKDSTHVLTKQANMEKANAYGDLYQFEKSPSHQQSSYWNTNPFGNSMATPFTAFPSQYTAAPYSFSPFETSPLMDPSKLFPYFGVQPIFIPFPLIYTPMLYANAPMPNFEDSMSRTPNGRRPSASTHARDSPIYYMRFSPTPYMFLPNFDYTPAATPNFNNGFSPFLPYQSFTPISGLSPQFNLPVNFMANGKPSGIYQMTSLIPNEMQNTFSGFNGFNIRPQIPTNFGGNYAQPPTYGFPMQSSQSSSTSSPAQDSKMTLLKQPFIFNGRPEDMYVLQNSYNPMFNGI